MFVRNGVPDGYIVRLSNLEEKHFPTATRVEKLPDESIEIWFDRIFLGTYHKGAYLSYWKVYEREGRSKSRRLR